MPSNVYLTAQLYTKLVLMDLGQRLKVTKNMSPAYSKEFGNKSQKINSTFNVRKPQRFVGADLTASNLTYSPDAITDTSVAITCDKVAHVGFEFNSFDRTMSLNEAYDLAKPASIAIASKVNAAAAKFAALNTFNSVGTPGTAPTTLATYLQAEDKLVQLGMPEDTPLTAIVNRKMSSALVGGSSALFNNSAIIGEQHSKGRVVNQLGYEFEIDQTIYTHTTGLQGGSPVVAGAGQTGTNANNGNGSLNISGATASITLMKAGDVFTIANVNSVHPQTRVSTGDLQQFVAMADVVTSGTGTATISMYPDITATGQFQNIDSVPAAGAAIVIWSGAGSISKASPQGLLLTPNAFAFLSVPFENPAASGVEAVAQETDPDTGLSISFVRGFDIVARKHINRFDALYGFGRLYPELACRIVG